MVAVHGRAERGKLIHSSGTLGKIVCQTFEVVQGFVDAWVKGDPFAFNVEKDLLYLTE